MGAISSSEQRVYLYEKKEVQTVKSQFGLVARFCGGKLSNLEEGGHKADCFKSVLLQKEAMHEAKSSETVFLQLYLSAGTVS